MHPSLRRTLSSLRSHALTVGCSSALFVVAACGGTPTGPTASGSSSGSGQATAPAPTPSPAATTIPPIVGTETTANSQTLLLNIAGVVKTPTLMGVEVYPAVQAIPVSFSLVAMSDSFTFMLAGYRTVGTYDISTDTHGMLANYGDLRSGDSWSSTRGFGRSSGTVTITSVTANSVSGTFAVIMSGMGARVDEAIPAAGRFTVRF